jgi:hypothetical protein
VAWRRQNVEGLMRGVIMAAIMPAQPLRM